MTDINKVRDELADQFTNSAAGNAERCMECGYHTIVKVEDAFKAGFDAAIAHLSKQSVAFDKRQAVKAFADARENKDGADSLTTGDILEFQHQKTSLIYEAKLAVAVEALKSVRGYSDIYQYPEHEIRHALAVEIPHDIDEALQQIEGAK